MRSLSSTRLGVSAALALAACVGVMTAPIASGALVPTTSPRVAAQSPAPTMPDYTQVLAGYEHLWKPQGDNTLHGSVVGQGSLDRNDELVSWINQHATTQQQFRALQNSKYSSSDTNGYDQSMTIADGLGKTLGALYVKGRQSGALPLTSALLNSKDGSAGHAVETNDFKSHFSYPRPFLRANADGSVCAPQHADASSLVPMRRGEHWADAGGDLTITQVPAATDTTHEFSTHDVKLDPGYAGLCRSGSFPSGHTATAYEAGTTLATLLPEVAPSILARASEAGNNRIVLGVHYPLDVIGGRITGQSAVATLWNDDAFRTSTLEPAREELRTYLTKACTEQMHVATLADCVAKDTPYSDDPYGGATMPGGSSQKVSDRASALAVYTERLSYGIGVKTPAAQGGSPTVAAGSSGVGMAASAVPDAAVALLRTTYPTLTDAERRSVLAQTALPDGNPLATGQGEGWQRLNLAAAMSSTVRVDAGAATVTGTGGEAEVNGHAAASGGASSTAASSGASSGAGGVSSSGSTSTASSNAHIPGWPWFAIGLAVLGTVLGAISIVGSRRRR